MEIRVFFCFFQNSIDATVNYFHIRYLPVKILATKNDSRAKTSVAVLYSIWKHISMPEFIRLIVINELQYSHLQHLTKRYFIEIINIEINWL